MVDSVVQSSYLICQLIFLTVLAILFPLKALLTCPEAPFLPDIDYLLAP